MSEEDGAGAAADMAKEAQARRDTVYESAAPPYLLRPLKLILSVFILSERSNHHSILIVPIAIVIGID